MTTTDWIQFWLAIGTGILAIISTISIVIVLFQNKQIIEDSKKANIIVYKDTISINSQIEYLVIKNSGNTTAHITSILYNQDDIDKLSIYKLNDALKHLNNCYLAPNQSYKIPFKSNQSNIEVIEFKIDYYSGKKFYSNSFTINVKQDYGIANSKSHLNNGRELQEISNILQELVKRIN